MSSVGEQDNSNDIINQQKTSKIPTKILKGKLIYADSVKKPKGYIQVETLGTSKENR